MPSKILVLVIGTRPEAIKLAPVFGAAERSGKFIVKVVLTGQHREMLDQVISIFGLPIEADLTIMRPDQSLSDITVAALTGLTTIFRRLRPDCVVVQGDTTTTFSAALAAFYLKIPVAHVEAGLRTFDMGQPFPEEANRALTSRLTSFHFAPTKRAEKNLLREHIPPERIWVTGNTVVDALIHMRRLASPQAVKEHEWGPLKQRTILVTAHRRENHGEALSRICDAVLELLARYENLHVRFPVHPNPNVQAMVWRKLSANDRVHLTGPLDYPQFVAAMDECDLILTDSGGVQEEAPSLGKPVLVLREKTERLEAIEAGVAKVIGTNRQRIVSEVSQLLDDENAYRRMAEPHNPYGDGLAAQRIVDVLSGELSGISSRLRS